MAQIEDAIRGNRLTAAILKAKAELLPPEHEARSLPENIDYLRTVDLDSTYPRQDRYRPTITAIQKRVGEVLDDVQRFAVSLVMHRMGYRSGEDGAPVEEDTTQGVSWSFADTLKGFAQIAETTTDQNIVVWVNEYFGRVEYEGKPATELKAFLDHAAPDRERLVRVIADRHSIRVDKDDPLFAVGTICEAYIDEAGHTLPGEHPAVRICPE